MPTDRGQLSLSAVEVAVGVLVVFAVTAAFAGGVPDPGRERAQLDRYARDVAAALADEPADGTTGSLLAAASRSPTGFAARSDELERAVDRLRPPGVLVRVETPEGAVGPPRPRGTSLGTVRVATPYGTTTVEAWYA